MRIDRRATLALLGGLAMRPALADEAGFPQRPPRLIVPYAPGGPVDIVTRGLAAGLADVWRHNVVVENRGGAGGNLGSEAVARAAPDGHTMLVNTPALAIAAAVMRGLTFHPVDDLVAVSKLGTTPAVLVASPSLPANSVAELIALAKAAPGRYSFASPGPATSLHLAAELFCVMAGIEMVHVPYRGGAPALIDIMAGQPQMMFNPLVDVLPHIREGRLKGMALSSAERSSAAPEIPTVAESGLPGYDFSLWYGLFAPKGTPLPLVQRIGRDVGQVLRRDAVRDRFAASGVVVVGSTPEAFAAELRGEVERWSTLARRIGLSAG